ncbi:hypothetical protein Dda_3470 [Drechslerella dactyloides]|uniref:MARVEL domain-containing protein n=1 Tax=Drechslerella dactyloides TaxID=74499 RepID=A0AAD6NMV3_DREDA|nr:hypothetical protein Dda_3470 [Drechslerella dactyloides]
MAVIAKLLSTVLRCAQVLGALYNTGCVTYFIVELSKKNQITGKALAVEIISAAGLLWASFVLVFSICLLQKSFFQFFTVLGDLLFIGGFVAVTILLKDAWNGKCNNRRQNVPWLERAGSNISTNCQLVKGIFIVSIALSVLFFFTLLTSFLAHSHAKKDRAYGPSPANNYTSGRGKRSRSRDLETAAMTGPALAPPNGDNRPSHESKFTDVTERTNSDGLLTGTTPGVGREYLAPRGYAGVEGTVSPVPGTPTLRGKEHSHAGQYAMAGALVGGGAAAAAHHHQHHPSMSSSYSNPNDNLPNHPTPDEGINERIPMAVPEEAPERLGTMNTYGTNANSLYSELDNTTTSGPPSAYAMPMPGAYPSPKPSVQPTAFYPAAHTNASELPSSLRPNPHFYSREMDAGNYTAYTPGQPQELGSGSRSEDELNPMTPEPDQNRDEVGFGYGNGPGMIGGGSNEVSTLPELGREDGQRF